MSLPSSWIGHQSPSLMCECLKSLTYYGDRCRVQFDMSGEWVPYRYPVRDRFNITHFNIVYSFLHNAWAWEGLGPSIG